MNQSYPPINVLKGLSTVRIQISAEEPGGETAKENWFDEEILRSDLRTILAPSRLKVHDGPGDVSCMLSIELRVMVSASVDGHPISYAYFAQTQVLTTLAGQSRSDLFDVWSNYCFGVIDTVGLSRQLRTSVRMLAQALVDKIKD